MNGTLLIRAMCDRIVVIGLEIIKRFAGTISPVERLFSPSPRQSQLMNCQFAELQVWNNAAGRSPKFGDCHVTAFVAGIVLMTDRPASGFASSVSMLPEL
jgi:hypothetical protein